MRKLKLGILLLLLLLMAIIVGQNTAPVAARFLWLRAEVPVVVLLFLTAAGGFFVGLLAALFLKSGR